jgi:ferric-dicitrate binding protein FerR (iron transport regulator)
LADQNILLLLQRYLDDQLTETEYAELAALLKKYPEDQPWTEWLQELEKAQPAETGYDRNRWQPVIESILQGQRDKVETRIETVPVIGNRRRYGWAAAAAILIGISTGTYLLIQKFKPVPATISAVPAKRDIAPGGNKAVLTLSNGSKIILDSAANGLLANQNGSNIIKTDSGKLVYNASKTTGEKPLTTIVFNTLTTPRGGQYQLTLPDGTKVWLNAASSITYPTAFVGKERKVTVTGEAYLEVIHNRKLPFRVQTGDQTVQDIGTAFNINAYPDENAVKTTLIQGSVKLTETKTKRSVVLSSGQQARFANNRIQVNNKVDITQVTAWKNGLFDFQDMKLEAAMQQLARWYDMDVVYEKGIPDIEFVGKMKRDLTLSELLHFLEESGVHFRIEAGRKLIVMP